MNCLNSSSTMSILAIFSNFSLLSLLLLLFLIYILRKQTVKLLSFMLSYIVSASTHLKWACKFLIQNSLFGHRIGMHGVPAEIGEELLTVGRYERNNDNEAVECAVCLCEIEEGEEIRELRCDHIFHRVCLDQWVGLFRQVTCPLCRDFLDSRRAVVENGIEILVFKRFCYLSSSSDRDSWWLR